MGNIEFLDCNMSYGPDASTELSVCADFAELKRQMNRSGVAGGLVFKALQEPVQANATLAEDIKGEDDLTKGVWSLLPSCTGEIPPPYELPLVMKQNNIAALTINPQENRFMPRKLAIGDYMEMARERKIPVLLNTSRGLTMEQADDIMRDFPDLTVILAYNNRWPNDRMIRPFVESYLNLHLDITYVMTNEGIKDMLLRYPAEKILFGSGFPMSYMGAHILEIKHAEISEDAKCLIAGGNLKRLLREVRYD